MTLQTAIEEHDFEVTLAAVVNVPGLSSVAHAEAADAEHFFTEAGFEYVDTEPEVSTATDDEDADARETIGVARVVDALSTILWPNMTRKGAQRASRLGAPIVIGPGRSGEGDALLAFFGGAGAGPKRGATDDLDALERWLDEDESGGISAPAVASPLESPSAGGLIPPAGSWTRFSSSSTFLPLPTSNATPIKPPTPSASDSSFIPPESSVPTQIGGAEGFDDDFSDFVTASEDAGYNALDDSEDEDLPSHAEIMSTSARIFGPAPPSTLTKSSSAEKDASYPAEDEDFDISAAFSTLQAMREEISGIEDEGERRRAAARVALGFAYGLDLGGGDGESGGGSGKPTV